MQSEQILIQKIASRPSTEELILFIAENDAMTKTCSLLHKALTRDDKKKLREISELCQRYNISVSYLTRELNHIQSIFGPQQITSDDHKRLGLQPGASIAEIKQAYRRLSIQHHPDTSSKSDPALFIEITKSYRRLVDQKPGNEHAATSASSAWRYKKKASPRQQPSKKYIYFISLLSGGILLVILTLSFYYQKRVMLNNLGKVSSPSTHKQVEKATEEVSKTGPSSPAQPQFQFSQPSTQPAHYQLPEPPIHIAEKTQERSPVLQKSTKIIIPSPSSTVNLEQSPIDGAANTETEANSTIPSQNLGDSVNEENDNSLVQQSTVEGVNPPPEVAAVAGQEAPFAEIFKHIESSKKNPDVPPGAASEVASNNSKNEDKKSLFAGKKHQQPIVIKAKNKKIQKKTRARAEVKQQQPLQEKSPMELLRKFISNYTATYARKDIQKFSLLFTKDAQENGTPFSKMRNKYIQLFQAVQSIDYHIDVLGTDIQDGGSVATVTGRFRVKLIYSPDKIRDNSGTLTFFLVKNNEDFKVKGLSYNLDPKW
ncbi:MAG: DnaJ domain-containing protein [Candidatus Electrothrix aestuarii]|uniref:DnaJ domain-containing protein n=1 Tax=Candidatus Electrothrix aestuarii TaxID=3062594 RepID=A0AAU8LTC4_9BACT